MSDQGPPTERRSAEGRGSSTATQDFARAVGAHRTGRIAEAEAIYRSLLQNAPGDAASLHGLALICSQTGRTSEALDLYERAEALSPDDAGVQGDLGNLLFRLGRFEDARKHYERMLALEPANAATHANLGSLLKALGQLDAALIAYARATELNPTLIEPHLLTGSILLIKGRFGEARNAFAKVLAAKPDHAGALEGAGNALNALGRPAEAILVFKNLLAVRPDSAGAYFGLANAYQQVGNFADGRRALEQAVRLAPHSAKLHYALAKTARFTAADPRWNGMRVLQARSRELPPQERAALHFALAKAEDDLGRYQEAFSHLQTANEIMRGTLSYDAGAEAGEIRRIGNAMPSSSFPTTISEGHDTDAPIFIVGMPRSGTSLVEQILASHPNVFGAGELSLFEDAMEAVIGRTGDALTNITPGQLKEVGTRYVAQLRSLRPGAPRITDKMPGNFRYLGLIHLALPHARIIHVARDPMDTCFSCYATLFESTLPFAYDFADLGQIYRAYAALMAHWRCVLPSGVMLDLSYEGLVSDFEAQTRRMLDFCGLRWDERCLRFHESKNPVRTASQHQVRQGLFQASIGRSRHYAPWLEPLRIALAEA